MESRASKSRVQAELRCQRFHLSFARLTNRKNFLERNDIRVEIRQNLSYPPSRSASVHSPRLVDIVGDDSHTEILPRSMLSRRNVSEPQNAELFEPQIETRNSQELARNVRHHG